MKTAILGAGLAGLEVGRHLQALGKQFVLLEKEAQVGGLARTIRTGDYQWDFGVHAMYSPDPEISAYYRSLPLDYQESDRYVKIVHTGSKQKKYLIDYPFEEGVKDLPLPHRWECLRDYLLARRRQYANYANVQDWITHALGQGIAKHFMIPYNQKIWDADLDQISMDLVSAKIHPTSVKDFVFAALGNKVVGRAYQARFLYPRSGIQALMDLCAKNVLPRIRFNCAVEKIERQGQRWVIQTTQGREEADKIISTIPLVELLRMLDRSGIPNHHEHLRWNDTYFVMIGLRPQTDFKFITKCHWVFFKEKEIFYRVTLMRNFSKIFLPALVAEITHKGPITAMGREKILEQVIADLTQAGIIADPSDVAMTDVRLVKYTYPIPTVGLKPVKEHLIKTLRQENIELIGRNGRWDYVNMDGVIRSVKALFTNTEASTP